MFEIEIPIGQFYHIILFSSFYMESKDSIRVWCGRSSILLNQLDIPNNPKDLSIIKSAAGKQLNSVKENSIHVTDLLWM